jgi:hypothetical protein
MDINNIQAPDTSIEVNPSLDLQAPVGTPDLALPVQDAITQPAQLTPEQIQTLQTITESLRAPAPAPQPEYDLEDLTGLSEINFDKFKEEYGDDHPVIESLIGVVNKLVSHIKGTNPKLVEAVRVAQAAQPLVDRDVEAAVGKIMGDSAQMLATSHGVELTPNQIAEAVYPLLQTAYQANGGRMPWELTPQKVSELYILAKGGTMLATNNTPDSSNNQRPTPRPPIMNGSPGAFSPAGQTTPEERIKAAFMGK